MESPLKYHRNKFSRYRGSRKVTDIEMLKALIEAKDIELVKDILVITMFLNSIIYFAVGKRKRDCG